ncbi:carboxypeptidase-like regulatory domain-containing protein [Knoellia remsis]|nr:carboxypeptidase-like regulatory domain-containing protein [Knoellia remsis]
MRSFIMRLGGALLTTLLALGLLSAPAHAEPSTLSGTITSDVTGEPVGGCVTAYDTDYTYVNGTCSDETGAWTLDVEAGVAYKLEVTAFDGRHVGEWAQDADSFEAAQAFVAPATVDVGLRVGGTIGGSLTRADGSPAEGASVSVLRSGDLTPVAWTSVGASPEVGASQWSTVVAPGEYVVEFWDNGTQQWAIGQTSIETATRFSVTSDATTRVDDRFLGSATVTGVVRSDATGQPVEGVCVGIFIPTDDPDNIIQPGEGCTGADGRYEVALSEEGTFAAVFSDPQGRFVAEYSGDTRVLGDAETFTVSRQAPAVVDALLATASTITGRAVDAKTGAPIADACPSAYAGRSGGYVRGQVSDCSGADGRWAVKGLASGEYTVAVDADGEPRVYSRTWAYKATSQATAALITVPAASTKAIRDVQMLPGGTVTGVITGPTGQPVADAWVRIDGGYPGRVGPGEGPYTAQTDANGRYTIQGVPPGEHSAFVYTMSDDTLAPEWSGNALTSSSATTFQVKALKTTTFNAQLAPASRLGITVVGADGAPIDRYLTGTIYNAAGDYIGDFDSANGTVYGPGALPAGSFTLRLEDGETGEVWWYDGVTRESGRTAVTLASGERKEITFRVS